MNGVGNYGRRRDLSWTIAIIVTVLLVAFFGWLVFRSPDDSSSVLTSAARTTVATEPLASPVTLSTTPAETDATTAPLPDTTTTDAAPATTSEPSTESSTSAPDTTVSDSTLVADTTTTAPPTITTLTPADPPPAQTYPTLSDGSAEPIVVIYEGDNVIVSGNVPTPESKALLLALAEGNSISPSPIVTETVTINPDVPIQIGVRVLDADSVRFPDGSAAILPEHALQLDRVVNVLNALTHVDVLIVGHSDQRGSNEQNFQISRDRAQAVADYFVAGGVSALRINSRAVGEEDLLTDNVDAASLALNRRTEFVFYGLLVQ